MKPIRLSIKGLNSFVEEQSIDFEQLMGRGFFGIFGPTGSGKSTILDGITLALYGLKAMSRETNEFINTNCASAMISFEFQISGNTVKRYRVEREFKRFDQGARAWKCRLIELGTKEQIMEDTVTGVDQACRGLIGLTADDFMRTVVLPQGKFSEFLKAGGKERREILERLFQLEEFGKKLEDKISEALRNVNSDITNIQGQMQAYGPANEKELVSLAKQQKECELQIRQLEADLNEFEKTYSEGLSVWELQKEKQLFEEKMQVLISRKDEILQAKKKLKEADRTRGAVPLLKSFYNLEKEILRLGQERDSRQGAVSKAEKQAEANKESLEEIKQRRLSQEDELKQNRQNGLEALKRWEELPGLKKIQKELLEKIRQQEDELAVLADREQVLERQLLQTKEAVGEQEKLSAALTVSSAWRKLTAEGFRMTEDLEGRQVKSEQDAGKLKALLIKLESEYLQIEEYRNKIAKAEAEIEEMKTQQEVCRMESEELYAHSLRQKLKNETPCPVCGAIYHEKDDLPDVERLSAMEAGENEGEGRQELIHLQEHLETLEIQLTKCSRTLRKLEIECGSREGTAVIQKEQAELLKKEWNTRKEEQEAVQNCLIKLKKEAGVEDFTQEYKSLQESDRKQEELLKKLEQFKKELDSMADEREILRQEIKQGRETLALFQIKLAPVSSAVEQNLLYIEEKIKDSQDPSQYLTQVEQTLSNLMTEFQRREEAAKLSLAVLSQAEAALNHAKGQYEGLQARRVSDWAALEKEIQKAAFSGIEEMKAAILTDEAYQEICSSIELYEIQWNEAAANLEAALRKLCGRKISAVEKETMETAVLECRSAASAQKEFLGELKQQTRILKENIKKQKELTILLETAEHRQGILSDLKSVTRGKRFVEFMAAERLKYISQSASLRLLEITNNHYELEINQEGEFVIRDNHNGGVLRAPATLSGGETFVTSLALALALSSEIQLKGTAPLELFFLDEGFGSLDENLLDVVMDSLERIHSDHLKVGIISHIESVKARVPVRLLVSAAEAGVSGSRVRIEYL